MRKRKQCRIPEDAVEVQGCPGYWIDRNGTVYSTLFRPKVKRSSVGKDGYHRVNLVVGGKSVTKYVHRLVALAFVSGYTSGLTVNHKDCDKSNNKAENLEWMTFTENHRHWRKVKPDVVLRMKRNASKALSRPIYGLCLTTGKRTRFYGLNEASRRVGGDPGNICNCARKGGACYGYTWKYV